MPFFRNLYFRGVNVALGRQTPTRYSAAESKFPADKDQNMAQLIGRRQKRMARKLAWFMLCWMALAITANCAVAQAPGTGYVEVSAPSEEPGFIQQIWSNLFNSRALLATLSKPEFTLTAFIALNLIVFVETGLLVGFFLPGDSLLVTAGVACYLADWNLPLLLATLCVSAIVGDSVGYSIGLKTGPKIFNREKSWLFNKEHLLKAHEFYERHGGKTIVLARFMPIIRTFAPVVAGVAKMEYRKFLFFNVIGGVSWVLSMILIGFSLPMFLDDVVQRLLGNSDFHVQDHIEKVVILVVFLSISPGIYVWLKNRMKKKGKALPVESQPELLKAK
jgi:membrane-associated protein